MKHWLLSLILLLFFVEVFSVLPHRLSPQPPELHPESVNYVSGLINVHTLLSDGFQSVPQLAALAKQLGHSFVIFADQNTLEGKHLGWEKSYDGLDAFIEMESKTPSGELLIFYSHVLPSMKNPKEVGRLGYDHFLGNQPKSNIFVSVSHPSHVKKPWTQLERFPDGIELFNFDSLFWRRLYSNPIDFLGLALLYPLNPFVTYLRLNQPYQKDFSNWDNMNTLNGSRFGFVSSEFSPKLRFEELSLEWPSYKDVFQMGSNIVYLSEPLASDFNLRKKQIYQSIREGRLALNFPSLFPFNGNDSFVKCENSIYRSGDFVDSDPKKCAMTVNLPKNLPFASKVRLIRNGEIEQEIKVTQSSFSLPLTQRGAYRVEVWVRPHSFFWILLRKWVPYVFYNPVFLK